MTSHRFTPSRLFNTLGPHAPVLEIASGDEVTAETADAHGFDHRGQKIGERPNPMTGPFFIQGAEPGDALRVFIRDIRLTRKTGWTYDTLAATVIDPQDAWRFGERRKTEWLIDVDGGRARLAAPPDALRNWSVAIEPMIGCFGVAPPLGQAISTVTSGPYGGNMDYRGFRAGVEVLFPVSVPGALFFLGDVHACQSDGEIVGTGIETAAEVSFTAEVIKQKAIHWPRGRSETDIFTIGNARPLDQALQHATTEMLHWLMEDYGLDAVAAAHVMGQCVRYDVANAFNPAYSIACRIPQEALVALSQ